MKNKLQRIIKHITTMFYNPIVVIYFLRKFFISIFLFIFTMIIK